MLCIFMHIICIFWAYICIFYVYNLHICYVEVYIMAYFVHILACKCISNAYSSSAGPRRSTGQQMAVQELPAPAPPHQCWCDGRWTLAHECVYWQWNVDMKLLLKRNPNGIGTAGPPSAPIGEPNPPGRQPPWTMQARRQWQIVKDSPSAVAACGARAHTLSPAPCPPPGQGQILP